VLAGRRCGAPAHLGVDRIDRHRPDRDADVARTGFRHRGFEIDQRVGGVDRERFGIAYSLHLGVLRIAI
jgi:hypothetical protein